MGEQELLRKLGIWTNLSGYQYLMKGFEMIRMDPDYLQYVTKRLYPDIADVYQMSWPSEVRIARRSANFSHFRGCICAGRNRRTHRRGNPGKEEQMTFPGFFDKIY